MDLLGFQTIDFQSLDETRTSIFETLGSPNQPFALQDFTVSLGINTGKFIKNTSIGLIIGSKSMTYTKYTTETMIFGLPIYYSDNEGYSAFLDDPMYVEVLTAPSPVDGIDDIRLRKEVIIRSSHITEVYGFTVNYLLVEPFKSNNFYEWNGLSLGSGFILNNRSKETHLDMSQALDLPDGSLDINLLITSSAKTVPLEISTGFKLFSVINITSGVGMDIQMSSFNCSYINLDNDSLGANLINKILEDICDETYGDLEDELSFKPRFNIGAGIGFGALLCDVSLSYYLDSAITFGSNVVVKF